MKIYVVGNSDRQKITAQCLKGMKDTVVYEICGGDTNVFKEADVIVLPIPVSTDGIHINSTDQTACLMLEDVINCAKPSAIITGGKTENQRILDICKRDDFAYLNAVPTAEAAIAIAIQSTPFTLNGSSILVAGFGRVGKILADRLKNSGANITVSARKSSDIALIEALGYNSLHTKDIKNSIKNFNIVFNTIEHPVFNMDVLSCAHKDTCFIELASFSAGFDSEAINKYEINFINAPALPGKYAPKTAGEINAKTVINILKENNLLK